MKPNYETPTNPFLMVVAWIVLSVFVSVLCVIWFIKESFISPCIRLINNWRNCNE